MAVEGRETVRVGGNDSPGKDESKTLMWCDAILKPSVKALVTSNFSLIRLSGDATEGP